MPTREHPPALAAGDASHCSLNCRRVNVRKDCAICHMKCRTAQAGLRVATQIGNLKTAGPASHTAVWESDVRKSAVSGCLIYSSRDLPAALNRIVVRRLSARPAPGVRAVPGSRKAPVRTRLQSKIPLTALSHGQACARCRYRNQWRLKSNTVVMRPPTQSSRQGITWRQSG